MELQWIPSATASCYHAADGLRRGWQLANDELASEFREAADSLVAEIRGASLPEERFWEHLCAFGHQIESNQQLVRQVLQRAVGAHASNLVAQSLAGRIADLEAAMRRCLPDANTELEHRRGPLKEHWEARGPGLLHAFAGLTDPRLVVDRAEIVLVHPSFGGGGAAHLMNNSIRVEAVLANVVPELPEVLRVGWLLAQLNHDLPMFGERVHGERLRLLTQLATLPPILVAGDIVELASLSQDALTAAITTWRIDAGEPAEVSATLLNWWGTYQDACPTWDIALAGLDQMLA